MNRLFLTAITGECCLYAKYRIKAGYNPFTLLRAELKKNGIEIKGNAHLPILLQLKHIYEENNISFHKLLLPTIEELRNKKITKEQMQMSNHDRIFK